MASPRSTTDTSRLSLACPIWRPINLWALATLTLASLTLAGCAKPVELKGDGNDARQTLTKVFEAWKQGQPATSFAQQTPPWIVSDEDWSAGAKLLEFEIAEPIAFGGHWRVPAKIRLSTEKQGELQRQVAYAVTLQPAVSVIRADDVID